MNGYGSPSSRTLAVFAFDPSMGLSANNVMRIKVGYEPLAPGPVGAKLAVLDYDASNHCWYEPVDLNHPAVMLGDGLDPSESDPRFHQQMVYAVASETIERFEFALGREIQWHRRPGPRKRNAEADGRQRLRIFPHAFQQANAFYDPDLCALLFGYFAASETDAGDNLPGQTVFTCLSHDIIAHETTHAVLDRIRRHFSEATSADTPAFHEAFADIVALFQHFKNYDAIVDTIDSTEGLLYRDSLEADVAPQGETVIGAELGKHNPLVALAEQFGEAIGTRKALRSAIGSKPDPALMKTVFEPHDRGSILVAAVFDAFFSSYVRRTRDLIRIARAGGAVSPGGELHPDLTHRLAREATKVATQFLNICIRAIDYCPPVDLQFGEYLRAMVTADSDLVPEDAHGYRAELIAAFRRRGIVPEEVKSYAEESLRWCGPAELGFDMPPCRGLTFDVVKEQDEQATELNAERARHNAQVLHAYAKKNVAELGLSRGRPIQVGSFHPIYRIGPNGRLVVEFVVEFLQQQTELLMDDQREAGTFTFRGGSTVIFDHKGQVKYVVSKSMDSDKRLQRQRDFQLGLFSPLEGVTAGRKLNFGAVHRGLER